MEDANKVWEIKVLKTKPGNDKAKQFLERIAKQVQPIMRKHNWRVELLSELSPKKSKNLGINCNFGREVKLRLRRYDGDLNFFPFDEVLDTMLHELCHNAHTRHDSSFNSLWNKLRKECKELMAKGITGTGEGFDLPGRRLGGFSRQPPFSSLGKTALSAAENRLRLNTLLPSGPLRLGDDKKTMTALSPAQAASMAAERRLKDDIWCTSALSYDGIDAEEENDSHISETVSVASTSKAGHSNCSASVSQKRSRESDNNLRSHNFVDLTSNTNSTPHNVIDLTSNTNSTPLNVCDARLSKKNCGSNTTSTSVGPSTVTLTTANNCGEPVMWTCEACTLVNHPLDLVCNACETLKPKEASVKYKFWTCGFCTLENRISLEKCSACDQWRYSRGPLLSALPPNLGT